VAGPRFSISTRQPSCGDAYTREIPAAWQETETVPPVTVQVWTTGIAGGVEVTVVADSVERGVVRVVAGRVELEDVGVSDGSCDGSTEALVTGVGVSTTGVGLDVAVAALSLSETWGAERMFVDVPSSKAATARQTTKLVITVARTHEAAATPAIRRRDLLTT
jgi:hypothetical protein